MKGRKPRPSKIIDILGGSRHTHRPPRTDEPNPPAEIPKCPSFLDKFAKKEWKRMAALLADLGIIAQVDMATLAKYCESYSIWAQASKKIQEQGMIFMTPRRKSTKTTKDGTILEKETGGGLPIINPYFSIANKAKEQMEKSATEMGCTPSSRTRVKATGTPAKEEKPRERFFK